jgi:hypothetical protein
MTRRTGDADGCEILARFGQDLQVCDPDWQGKREACNQPTQLEQEYVARYYTFLHLGMIGIYSRFKLFTQHYRLTGPADLFHLYF